MEMLGGPLIVHVDDVREQEVVRVEYEDGRKTSIFERFLLQSPRFFSFWNRWEPGMISLKHGHRGDHVVFVLDGEVTVGDVLCRKGTHIFHMYGDTFGPWIAGPNGCELLGIIAGDCSAFWSNEDMADYQALLASRGGTMGAVPQLQARPAWAQTNTGLPGPTYDPDK
jgi:hypothetical protein